MLRRVDEERAFCARRGALRTGRRIQSEVQCAGRERRGRPEVDDVEWQGRSGSEWQAPLEDQLQSVDLVDLLADMPESE